MISMQLERLDVALSDDVREDHRPGSPRLDYTATVTVIHWRHFRPLGKPGPLEVHDHDVGMHRSGIQDN